MQRVDACAMCDPPSTHSFAISHYVGNSAVERWHLCCWAHIVSSCTDHRFLRILPSPMQHNDQLRDNLECNARTSDTDQSLTLASSEMVRLKGLVEELQVCQRCKASFPRLLTFVRQ